MEFRIPRSPQSRSARRWRLSQRFPLRSWLLQGSNRKRCHRARPGLKRLPHCCGCQRSALKRNRTVLVKNNETHKLKWGCLNISCEKVGRLLCCSVKSRLDWVKITYVGSCWACSCNFYSWTGDFYIWVGCSIVFSCRRVELHINISVFVHQWQSFGFLFGK